MTFHVQRQVIGASEAAFAHLAAERLGAGVFAYVASQFVRACEPPLAGGEVTLVGLLTWNTTPRQNAFRLDILHKDSHYQSYIYLSSHAIYTHHHHPLSLPSLFILFLNLS